MVFILQNVSPRDRSHSEQHQSLPIFMLHLFFLIFGAGLQLLCLPESSFQGVQIYISKHHILLKIEQKKLASEATVIKGLFLHLFMRLQLLLLILLHKSLIAYDVKQEVLLLHLFNDAISILIIIELLVDESFSLEEQ